MMTAAFGEETLGRMQVLEWISELDSGVTLSDMSQEWNVHHDQNRLECSLTKGTHSQKRIVTVRAVGNMLGTSFWSVHCILKYNMNYVWIGTKFVFCLLFVCVSIWLKTK